MRPRHLVLISAVLIVALGVLSIASCTTQPRYTSLDIDLMPCERGPNTPKFFEAIEFDKDGSQKYPHQNEEIQSRLRGNGAPVTDLIVFTHGWNKSPESAEHDYQSFICRLHNELEQVIGDRKRRDGLLIIGVFWPSTITNRAQEPYLLKPISYYNIRSRADAVAEKSLSALFNEIGVNIRSRSGVANAGEQGSPRIHLIGHSFGGRMVIRALETLNNDKRVGESGKLVDFLTSAELLNVVLLNAAMPRERFSWIADAIAEARRIQGYPEVETLARFTENTKSYLFNIHSVNDTPNRVLFWLASIFNSDSVECAVGACGIPEYNTLCVSDSGAISALQRSENTPQEIINGIFVWNADSQKIVFSHSDIYKGRVAKIVSRLLYDDLLRSDITSPVPNLPSVDNCQSVEAQIADG